MKKVLFFTLSLLVSVASFAAVSTTEFTYSDFSGKGTEGSGSKVSVTKNGITVGSDKLYGASSNVRIYSGTLTISADADITKIEITSTAYYNSNYGPAKLSYSGSDATYKTASGSQVGTWTANDFQSIKSVSLKASAQFRFTKIVVYTGSEDVVVNSLSLDQSSLSLVEGKSATLVATVDPVGTKIKWESSAPLVASVDNAGLVRGLMPGSATITASAGDKTATCAVTVTGDGEYIWFNKVTTSNISDLRNGDQVMISASSDNLMGYWSSGSNIAPINTGLLYNSDRTKCRQTDGAIYTLVKDGDNWNLMDGNSKYLQITNLKDLSATPTVNDNAKLSISFSGSDLKIAGKSGYGWIQYNGGNGANFFSTYSTFQSSTSMYYRHDDEASTLTWSPESLSFPNKRLKNGDAADTLELTLNFTNLDNDGVIFWNTTSSDDNIEFIVTDGTNKLDNLAVPGTVKVAYFAIASGSYTGTINLQAVALNGQEWDVKVPVSVTILEEAEEVQALTISEMLAAVTKENNIGIWGNSTSGTSTKEYLLGEVTVTSHVGSWIYVQDATGSLCIYDKENRTHAAGVYYQNGDVLSGIRGKVNVRKNAIDLQPGEGYEVVKVRSVGAIAPAVITEVLGVTQADANVNKYVKIEDATVTSDGKIKLGDRSIEVVNRLGASLSACDTKIGHYDIEGYVHANGSAMQLVVSKVSERELKAVESVSLNASTLNMEVGGTYQLAATIAPADASDQRVEWSSSNATLVSVDANGLLTAHKYTETPVIITVTTKDGSKTATCDIKVLTIRGARYEKVTDAAALNAGDIVVFVNEAAGKASGSFSTNGYYLEQVDATIIGDKVVANDAMGFVLAKSGSDWTLTSTTGKKLGTKGSDKNGADMNAAGTLTHTISNVAGAVRVANTISEGKYYIRYNNSFRYYSSVSSVADCNLYRKVAGTDPQMDANVANVAFEKKALADGSAADSETIMLTASDMKPETNVTVALKQAEQTIFSVSPSTLPLIGGEITISYEATAEGTYENTIVITAETVYDGTLTLEIPVSVTIDPTAPTGVDATYGLLQNPADLSEGDKVFFGTHAKDNVMGVYESRDNIHAVEATYDMEKHTVTANDLNAYTVRVTQDGKYQFVDYQGRYLVNYMGDTKLSSTEDGANQYTKWTITIGEKTDEALVCAKWPIYFNKTATTPLFKCYNGVDNNVAPIFLYSDHAPEYKPYVPNPQLTFTIGTETLGETLDWGEVVYDDSWGTEVAPYSESRSINIEGDDLSENITIAVTGTGFFTLKESITPKADGSVQSSFSINFETKNEGTYNGTLTITCGSITKTVALTAKAVKEATPDPSTKTELTVSTCHVYMNPYFSSEQGVEEMDVFYVSAKNLKKTLYCKWENTAGYSIPSYTGESMTVSIAGFGDVTYGSSLNMGTSDIDEAEVTVYVHAFNPGYYYSQLHFYTYEEDKVTIAAEYRVDLVVNMTTDETPDPDPTHDPNTDPITAIDGAVITGMEGVMYNLLGQPVDETYRGIVIIDGQKRIQY